MSLSLGCNTREKSGWLYWSDATAFPEMSCSPKSNCPKVTGTHDPVFFTVFKIQLGWIHNEASWWLTALHNTSHPCQQLQQHTRSNRNPPHCDPHSSNKFHFQLNSATFNFYLWSSVTWVHCAAPGGSWHKQDEFRLSPIFQSEMLPLCDSASLLALILFSLRLSPQSNTLCRDWKIKQVLLHLSTTGLLFHPQTCTRVSLSTFCQTSSPNISLHRFTIIKNDLVAPCRDANHTSTSFCKD